MLSEVMEKEPVSQFWSKIGLVADISRVMREKPAGKKKLVTVLDLISKIVQFDSATIYLANRKTGELEEAASFGETVNCLDFINIGPGSGLVGLAASNKKPILLPGRNPESRQGVKADHDSLLILPLLVVDQLVGVLCFSHREVDGFDKNRQKLLEIVADQIAISIERAMHQQELEQNNRSLLKAQKELKEAQAKQIDQEKLKAVAELAASVNHEVNNPLSVIVGNAQIIELESSELPDKIAVRVKAIVDSARRISLITHKLSKIDRLVSQNYIKGTNSRMLNILKSSSDHDDLT